MKYLLAKDLKKRKEFMLKESNYIIVKSLLINQNIKGIERFVLTKKLHKFKGVSFVRIKNRCYLTGRARAVFRIVNYNRCALKYYASIGYLVGVKKSSW